MLTIRKQNFLFNLIFFAFDSPSTYHFVRSIFFTGPVSQSRRMRPRSKRPIAPAASTPWGMSQRCTALQALYSRYTTRSKSTHVLSANDRHNVKASNGLVQGS